MGRPEHVKCGNCCYWKRPTDKGEKLPIGNCYIHPEGILRRRNTAFCRYFRKEWPEEGESLYCDCGRYKGPAGCRVCDNDE